MWRYVRGPPPYQIPLVYAESETFFMLRHHQIVSEVILSSLESNKVAGIQITTLDITANSCRQTACSRQFFRSRHLVMLHVTRKVPQQNLHYDLVPHFILGP